ncbi:permease prefix domain 1-containing protein [Peribacillus sp. NPDC096540]|uniref:permease prefix domain 1-containing protein n=1 Tax=Peribacillus sp. NPDC096540 TaxID=3390612 RepID=UPI003D0039A3
MKKEQFLHDVKQFIRSKEAKRFVSDELEFHLKQSTEALKKQGYTEEEAEVRAVQQMGSPITIGQKLNRLHRPKVDWRLTVLFLLVTALGFIPLFVLSAESYYYSFYAKLVGSLLGIGVAGAVMFMDYTKLSKFGWVFYHFPPEDSLFKRVKGEMNGGWHKPKYSFDKRTFGG